MVLGVSVMKDERQSGEGSTGRTLVIFAIIATLTGIWFGMVFFGGGLEPRSIAADLKDATLLPQPKQLEPFSLVDQDGKPVDRESLRGSWTFLAFGYTHCPDICPTMLATFAALERELTPPASEPLADFLFVSVDPERDTPERLGEYVNYFSPRIRGATAPHEVLRPLTKQLGILYARAEGQESAMGYMVDHSASMLLLDPEARLSAIFGVPHDPRIMAEDFVTISGTGPANR